ncbi:MAG: ABC transporter ATP-binding protein [Bacilli bacterium]|jgi:oligopeptide transport system ATP-binding protein|nr:ABC transporter ATP-binding protein [Bacilli bacterium]
MAENMNAKDVKEEEPMLVVKNLHVSFDIMAGKVDAVNGVSFSLKKGGILGIVGESGSGKSVSNYSIMQILDKNGHIDSGSIRFCGKELIGLSEKEMRKIRGDRIAIIFQDPMSGLNPVYTVGNQLIEAIRTHNKDISKKEAYKQSVEMLKLVGFNDPEKRMKQYPFEHSGGMLQRVMIAMALVMKPDLLIADEPTTALDVTIQAQIIDLLKSLQKKFGMGIIIVTHDLGVIAQIADEVDVMYAGRIVERGSTDEIFYNPKHEYTKGLIKSVPTLQDQELEPIKGNPVNLLDLPKGCSFSPRCSKCMHICTEVYPEQIELSKDHSVSCWNAIKELQDEGKIDVTAAPEGKGNTDTLKLPTKRNKAEEKTEDKNRKSLVKGLALSGQKGENHEEK